MTSTEQACASCQCKRVSTFCSICKYSGVSPVFYCSEQCRKDGWEAHQPVCKNSSRIKWGKALLNWEALLVLQGRTLQGWTFEVELLETPKTSHPQLQAQDYWYNELTLSFLCLNKTKPLPCLQKGDILRWSNPSIPKDCTTCLIFERHLPSVFTSNSWSNAMYGWVRSRPGEGEQPLIDGVYRWLPSRVALPQSRSYSSGGRKPESYIDWRLRKVSYSAINEEHNPVEDSVVPVSATDIHYRQQKEKSWGNGSRRVESDAEHCQHKPNLPPTFHQRGREMVEQRSRAENERASEIQLERQGWKDLDPVLVRTEADTNYKQPHPYTSDYSQHFRQPERLPLWLIGTFPRGRKMREQPPSERSFDSMNEHKWF